MGFPKKFLCAIPIGMVVGLLVLMSAVRFQLGVPTASSAWIKELTSRKQNAAAAISQPKIILLGGSATLFGLNASLIESELGLPVINGGLHAGIGLASILREGKKMITPGDTVVIYPEYELLNFGEKNRQQWAAITYLDYILSHDAPYYEGLPIYDQLEIALMTPLERLARGIKGKWIPEQLKEGSDYNPYDLMWLNDTGDMTGHIAARRPLIAEDRDRRECEVLRKGISLGEEGFDLISEFKQWADSNQVRVLAGFPSMAHRSSYDPTMIDNVEMQLKKFYTDRGINVVGNLRESLMPQVDFFDTIYHPTEETSLRISRRTASGLRPILDAL
jgi:hypothetical protein